MHSFRFFIPLFFVFTTINAQNNPTIYIDIPTVKKPWNHIEWNTAPEQFQFAIVTDRTGGPRPGVFPVGIKKLNLLQPEFVMSVGDLIEGYTRDTVQLNAEWKEFMSFIKPLDAPFFYVPGNHDITNAVMEEKWKDLFGVSYYHFVYKDVLFLCLNSEDNLRGAGRGTIDDTQFEYVKRTLEDNADVKWTLVFLHQPLWVQNDTKRWKDVEMLLADRNHNVFAGHYHRYWKSERNNGNYIALATTGGASRLRGKAYGEFDHVVWVTMTEEGPILANLFLDGIWDENVVTEELVNLVRNQPFPVRIDPIYLDETGLENMSAEVKVTNHSDTQMKVKLTGQAHDKMFYQLDQTSFTVEPNDVVTFNMNLKKIDKAIFTELDPIKITAEITYIFESQPNVYFSSVLNFMPFDKNTVKRVSKIQLDGKLDEWKGAEWRAVNNVEGSPFDYDGDEDFDMQFATAYDDTNFYVAVNLKDNDFFIEEMGSYWDQDAIFLGLDARPAHVSAFNAGEGRGRDWINFLRTFKKEKPVYNENRLPVSVTSEVQMTKNGATMEIAVPLEYIKKGSGEDWQSLRFGLGYYDYDNGDEDGTTHFWFPAWNSAKDIPGSGMLFKE
ncbi:metallophosphoesterase [Flagellimonas meridianipacifica]|uniref:Calcineurin-like phosphoesterase family protein n=1 Tax=Flagellimonas meridianipacifica TaxID=1080225 RepID=A0A2T0MBU8_9FLAO|nr:metallophosphoesterase [Allomuricauda pacifica]PRX54955.1 calcineurin-like phosphoesterase family protein [Allomuricauda pacifica]